MLLLVKLQTLACNFTKSGTPPWVFFTFLKLYKWYQISQSVSCIQSICPKSTSKDTRTAPVAFISYFEHVFSHRVVVCSSSIDLSNLRNIKVLEKVSA